MYVAWLNEERRAPTLISVGAPGAGSADGFSRAPVGVCPYSPIIDAPLRSTLLREEKYRKAKDLQPRHLERRALIIRRLSPLLPPPSTLVPTPPRCASAELRA